MNKIKRIKLLFLLLFIITTSNLFAQRLSKNEAKTLINNLTKSIIEHDTATFRKSWFVNHLINFGDCNKLKDYEPPYLPDQSVFLSKDNEIRKEFEKMEKLISPQTFKDQKTGISVKKLPKSYRSKYGLTHKITYSITDNNTIHLINFYMRKMDSDWLIMTSTEINQEKR